MHSLLDFGVRHGRGVVLLALAATMGCGGNASIDTSGDDTGVADSSSGDAIVDAPRDSGVDATKDTAPDSIADSGVDSRVDSGAADSGSDTTIDSTVDSGADSGADSGVDSGVDSAVDSAPDAVIDSTLDAVADVSDADTTDTPVDTRICSPGTLCPDGTICVGGTTCSPCTSDTECSGVATGTLCFGGSCLTATCHPATSSAPASGCTTGQACCAGTGTAGACFTPAAGGTACCADTDCTGTKAKCDTTSHTCVCPDPVAGSFFVGSKGSDTSGNGSSACPFQTITHALSTARAAPSTSWTINLMNDSGGTSTSYGAGCSATPTCDLTPISIPSTFTGGVSIVGSGTAAQVVVQGGTSSADKEVFLVNAPSVGFTHLTVMPMLTSSTGGADGIVIDAPAAASVEGTLSDLVVAGTSGSSYTGNAVVVRGGASPRIGPAFVVNGGARGLLVTNGVAATSGASAPTLRSAAGAQTTISGTVVACVRVETLTASAGPAPSLTVSSTDAATPVHLVDCGGLGGVVMDVGTPMSTPVSVSNALIERSTSGAQFVGVRLLNTSSVMTLSNTIVRNLAPTSGGTATVDGSTGILADAGSTLTISGGVVTTGDGRGVYVHANATATIDGLSAFANVLGDGSHGVFCDAAGGATPPFITLSIRNSKLVGNSGSGLMVGGACDVDLGSATSAVANNVFNTFEQANLGAGICYTSSAPTPTATGGHWACGADVGAGTCVIASGTGTNSPTRSFSCTGGKDLAGSLGFSGGLLGPQYCCGSVTVP